MFVAALAVVAALVLVIPMIHVVQDSWLKTPDLGARAGEAAFARWTFRALGMPLLLWVGWNSVSLLGPGWGWVPLIPDFKGSLGMIYLAGTAWGVFWATLIWSGFTLAWLLPNVIRSIRQRDEFDSLASLLGIAVVLLLLGAAWLGNWGLALLTLTGGLAGLFQMSQPLVHVPSPSYARAIGRMKRGHYAEAEQEVIQQLEEKSDDYEGWMMLAELYAEQFGQMAEAEQTVWELCEQPSLSAFDISRALTRLADWQLNRSDNPVAARATLTQILLRCPGTPFARTAENRIRQLPVDDAELRERRNPRVIRLGALREEDADPFALESSAAVRQLDAQTEATTLKKRLEVRPEDLPTRLRLARVLTERLGQIEAGLAELRLFRESPEASAGQQAEALAVEAAWQLKLRHNESEARTLLSRLVAEHPGSPQAMAARRQLDILEHPETYRPEPPPAPIPPQRIVIRLPSNPPESPPN